jgi:glycine cleavage system aminomethyltransferase T
VEKSLAFAYVEPALASSADELAVELYGARHAAHIISEPAYDPDNARLKG